MSKHNENNESKPEYKSYWINKLSGGLPTLNLPITKLRPNVKSNNGHAFRTSFSKAETEMLHNFTLNLEGSLFACLLATWNILFYRYTSQRDIILGTSIIDQKDSDLVDPHNFFGNTVLFRAELEPFESFNSFYHRIYKSHLLDYENQPYSIEQLVTDLDIITDKGRNSIFDIMVTFNKTEEKFNDIHNLVNTSNNIIDLGKKISKLDMKISFNEMEDILYFDIVYNTDVYERDMIESLMKHYKTLLSALIANPTNNVDEINYISDQERNLILNVFNKPNIEYPKNKTIVDLFIEQVERTPSEIAIVSNDKRLTYKELDVLSNQLANYLITENHIVTGDFVAILLKRSEWQIISILGILKSGAAYVPIDPAYPQERISYIQNDSKCKLTIDSSEIDTFQITKKNYSTTPPSIVNLKFNNFAYIIYTSGTTGNPKGVMIIHEAVVNLISYQTKLFNINKDEKIGQFSSYCFDASVEVIFLALLNGCSLYIISEEILKNHLLLSFLENNNITHLDATPSYLETLPDISHLSKLKRIIAGGESCSIKLAKKLGETCDFYNVYGPTENTVTSTVYKYSTEDNLKSLLPIGRPIGNTSAFILSQSQQLQGIGIIGELYLSGLGLSQGYLNRPELTSEKFLTNPFDTQTKMYRTGDLAKWLPDGNLLYLGRNDEQVKVNGHRIELGEIEAALISLPTIKLASVIMSTHLGSVPRLVAYLQPTDSCNKNPDVIEALSKIVPSFMIPNIFVWIDDFPLTPNGKIDKKNLPASEYVRQDSVPLVRKSITAVEKETTKLSTEPIYKIEKKVVQKSLFTDLPLDTDAPIFSTSSDNDIAKTKDLKNDSILSKISEIIKQISGIIYEYDSISNTFLELGLDSLSLIQLVGRLKKEFDLPITFRQLYETLSTPELLANYIVINYGELNRLAIINDQGIIEKNNDTSLSNGNNHLQSPNQIELEEIIKQIDLLCKKRDLLQNQQNNSINETFSKSDLKKEMQQSSTLKNEIMIETNVDSASENNEKIIAAESPGRGARLGRDEDGNPAWYIEDPSNKGEYIKINV
jgi:amino acid adenylation domain-containing protein